MLMRALFSAALVTVLIGCGDGSGDDNASEGGADSLSSSGTESPTTGAGLAGGEGSSCQAPSLFDVEASNSADFSFEPALAGEHTFSCGPLEPIPTRWFRFTANTDDFKIEVDTSGAADDYIIEVFSDATCAPAASLGCNDDDGTGGPELDVPVVENKTYFIGVGLKGAWSGAPATLEVDG